MNVLAVIILIVILVAFVAFQIIRFINPPRKEHTLSIGKVRNHEGIRLIVAKEHNGCVDCHFDGTLCSMNGIDRKVFGKCSGAQRRDKKGVIFKQLK